MGVDAVFSPQFSMGLSQRFGRVCKNGKRLLSRAKVEWRNHHRLHNALFHIRYNMLGRRATTDEQGFVLMTLPLLTQLRTVILDRWHFDGQLVFKSFWTSFLTTLQQMRQISGADEPPTQTQSTTDCAKPVSDSEPNTNWEESDKIRQGPFNVGEGPETEEEVHERSDCLNIIRWARSQIEAGNQVAYEASW